MFFCWHLSALPPNNMIAWFFWLIIIVVVINVIIIWTERPKKNILCLVNQNVFIWPGQEQFVGLLYEKAPTKRHLHDCKDKGFTSSGNTWLKMKNKTMQLLMLHASIILRINLGIMLT